MLCIIRTAYADITFNCSVYQDNKRLTTQQKTIASQALNSSWATYHPEQFASNYFKQSLCESVGLGKNKKANDATIRGIKYHNITVYKNQDTASNCNVQCTKANSSLQPVEENSALDAHNQHMKNLSLATGYITGAVSQ